MNQETVTTAVKTALKAFRPTPPHTVTEWADEHRYLDPATSAKSGKYNHKLTPYIKEIMDSLSDTDPIEMVIAALASQVGKTEALLNWLGYIASYAPAPTFIMQPTEKSAVEFSKDRVQPMINLSPILKNIFPDQKARDGENVIQQKKFPAGKFLFRGSNSPTSLASVAISKFAGDEIDRYELNIGREGNPLDVALQRTATYADERKIYLTSTPTTISQSAIWKWFLKGDQRKYFVPCPDCGEYQVLEFDNLSWRHTGRPDDVEYVCDHCGCFISEYKKTAMIEQGEWRPTADLESPDYDPNVRSYHLNALYSPIGWTSWPIIVKQFLAAGNDPYALQVWMNVQLGMPYDDMMGLTFSDEDLENRASDYAQGFPDDMTMLTAGVDTQDKRFEVSIWGWGKGEEAWLVKHEVIKGDPSMTKTQDKLRKVLTRYYHGRKVLAACIDSGGHMTDYIYKFTARPYARARNWYAIKGVDGSKRFIWDVNPSVTKKSKRFNAEFYKVGVDSAKTIIYKRLEMTDKSGPGVIHFDSAALDGHEDYFKQLTSETRIEKPTPAGTVYKWTIKKGRRNEALDCAVYALAALHAWKTKGIRIRNARYTYDDSLDGGDTIYTPKMAIPEIYNPHKKDS